MGKAEAETLRILREDGEAYQSDIVRATGLSKGTVSEVLAGLERRKLVRRVKVGRSSKVVLVAEGRRAGRTLRLGFTRAAEYPFLVPLRKMLRDDGVDLDFRVYDNGVSVARDLSLLRIDVGVAPLVTLFLLHSLEAPFKIIGPAGAGGCSILESPRARPARHEGVSAVCTKASTMELLIRSAENRQAIPEIGRLEYAGSPTQIERALMSGSADVCSIWEPYATLMEGRGAKRILRYSELSEHVCCAAAAGTHLGGRALARLSRRYASAVEALNRDRDGYAPAYAALSGLDSSALRRVETEYSYPTELSSGSVVGQLRSAGLGLPSPSSFADALLRP